MSAAVAAVVDASAAIAWLIGRQATEASQRFLPRVPEFALEAPFIFDWEVQNVLLSAAQTGRATAVLYGDFLRQLADFGIELGAPFAAEEVMTVARDHRLSLFDAAYLKQAHDRGVALISRDRALLTAASAAGVVVHDLT